MSARNPNANRRRIERLHLRNAASAALGGYEVRVLELSLDGAGIEHDMPFSNGRSAAFDMNLAGMKVRVSSNIIRCRLARREQGHLIYQSALEFRTDDPQGLQDVRKLMTQLVTAEIDSLRHTSRFATA